MLDIFLDIFSNKINYAVNLYVYKMAPTQGVLAQADFPLYAVQALGSTHFLVAGGGGQAKTGVPNAIVNTVVLVFNAKTNMHTCHSHFSSTNSNSTDSNTMCIILMLYGSVIFQ